MARTKRPLITSPDRNFDLSSASGLPLAEVLPATRLGNNPIRRLAIAAGARWSASPPGSAAIREVNLCVAAVAGKLARLIASCHGSRSSLASAEITLNGCPLPSSPTGAKRKSSNSAPRRADKSALVILATDRVACRKRAGHLTPHVCPTPQRRWRRPPPSGSESTHTGRFLALWRDEEAWHVIQTTAAPITRSIERSRSESRKGF